MAEKRMFSKKITECDMFLDMPDSCQNLYFHLSMNADDDGFVDKVKSIMRMIGAKDDDLKVLLAKSFVIPFDSGIIVITHWRMNNYLRKDRYVETTHIEEKNQLSIDKNNTYILKKDVGIPKVDQTVYQVATQYSIDKNSIDNIRECKRENSDSLKEEFHTLPLFKEILINDKFKYDISQYQKIHDEYKKSAFLRKSYRTLYLIHKHFDEILCGTYRDFKKDGKQADNGKVISNGNETKKVSKTYSAEEMNAVFDNMNNEELWQ